MARKAASKVEDLIDTLTDDRVTNAFFANLQDKFQECINEQMDKKLNEFITKLKESMAMVFRQVALDTFNELIPDIKKEIKSNEERINILENQNLQKDIVIHGLHVSDKETGSLNQLQKENMLMDSVCEQIKLDLNVNLERTDLNYAFRLKPKTGNKLRSSIIISLSSTNKRKEIIQSAKNKNKRKDKSETTKNHIFYNKRQTKENATISYKARVLVRQKQIFTTWVFKGETYIKEDISANPKKIITQDDLKKYE